MVGLLILKQLKNLSDESVVEMWKENPFFQAFCGMDHFQWKAPCNPTDLVHFRNRIGEKGMERIFQISVQLHGGKAMEREVVIDTTVQEKNITFPTDIKLRVKVIKKCWEIAKEENIELRRSYRRELKKLQRIIRFNLGKKKLKFVTHAQRRIKTIRNSLLREIERKLSSKPLQNKLRDLLLYKKVVNQERSEANKIYSLHEPHVLCISKGKSHKKYEFGNKVSLAITKTHGIIIGSQSFSTNEYDGNTLPKLLANIKNIRWIKPEVAYCDRGFRGKKSVLGTEIRLPSSPKNTDSQYQRRKERKNFGRRSSIEPIIGHLKSDFRMARNYLKGIIGDTINMLLACAAFNFRKWMRAYAQSLLFFYNIFYRKFYQFITAKNLVKN